MTVTLPLTPSDLARIAEIQRIRAACELADISDAGLALYAFDLGIDRMLREYRHLAECFEEAGAR